jgi:hypothetical protein
LQTPAFKDVQTEYNRIDELTKQGFQPKDLVSGQKNNPVSFGSETALKKFILFLGFNSPLPVTDEIPADNRSHLTPPKDRSGR